MLHRQDVLGGQHGPHVGRRVAGRRRDDRLFLILRRVIHPQLEHETIQLRLGEGIGPLLLDRVLRREHKERRRKVMRLAGGRDLMLLHRLQQRRLGLRGRAVHLVGEDDVRKHRPPHEAEAALPGGDVLFDDLRAGDVGRHQVGRELDPRELELERFGDGLHHQRLRESGHADEQRVAARENRGEDAVQHIPLAHDALADLSEQVGARGRKALEQLDIAGGSGRGRAGSRRHRPKVIRPYPQTPHSVASLTVCL